MTSVRVVINRKAVRDLLRGTEVQADLRRRAERIASAAGPDHNVHLEVGEHRARAAIVTGTIEARKAQAVRHTLERAIDAGR